MHDVHCSVFPLFDKACMKEPDLNERKNDKMKPCDRSFRRRSHFKLACSTLQSHRSVCHSRQFLVLLNEHQNELLHKRLPASCSVHCLLIVGICIYRETHCLQVILVHFTVKCFWTQPWRTFTFFLAIFNCLLSQPVDMNQHQHPIELEPSFQSPFGFWVTVSDGVV